MVRALLVLVLLVGCQKTEPSADKPTPAGPGPLQSSRAGLVSPTSPPKTVVEPLKADPRLKREVLVGGCQSRCAKPQQSLKGFMTAVMKKDIDDVRSFVDSSELIGNGERLGEQWANLFLERKLGERRESIDKWLKDWLAWVDRIADPADREKTEAGFTVVEENQRQYVVTYLHPDLTDGAATGVLWTFGLQTRGLEWLVVKIEVRPSP